jgi:hypothetical protein
MWRRKRETAPTATTISWTGIATNGTGGTRKVREVAEGGAQHNDHTGLAEKNCEEVREAHSAERRSIHPEEQGLLNISRQEKTCNSESTVTTAPAALVPTHAEVDRIECSVVA